jgi:DNA-binding transcriptional regulator YdaS (Cro superfamily)
MDLRSFLRALPLSERAALAAQANTTLAVINNFTYGWRSPSPLTAALLERATGGAVTRREMFPQTWHLIWPELIKANALVKKYPPKKGRRK